MHMENELYKYNFIIIIIINTFWIRIYKFHLF